MGCLVDVKEWEFLLPPQMYNRELEYEFNTFEDWLHTFNLYRGKCSDDADVEQNAADEDRLIGKFKVCCHSLVIAIFSLASDLLFLHELNQSNIWTNLRLLYYYCFLHMFD